MNGTANNDAACVTCGRVDTPIRRRPGAGGLALILWAAAVAIWVLGLVLGSLIIGYIAAPVFLGALVYTLW
jgi:hypothetical protein